ncbi:hypothetical protein [Mucilaginibacter flavidus]
MIWLRTGNISTIEIATTLLKLEKDISAFLVNNEAGVYEIHL